MSHIWEQFRNSGFSNETSSILLASWRSSTQKQYISHQNNWFKFASRKQVDPHSPSIVDVLEFLTELFNKGVGYSSINTARCALSALITWQEKPTIGSHPLVTRFLKGVYELRPPAARYKKIWDVANVFDYLRKMWPTPNLSLKQLSLKLVMLVALISAQRLQTIESLDISNMYKEPNKTTFIIRNHLKQSRPGTVPPQISLTSFPSDDKLDANQLLERYLEVTAPLRGTSTRLFISYQPPYKPVSRQTLARWIREVMSNSGLNIKEYTAHSVRAAASSAACSKNLPIEEILKTVGWKSERTFANFYKKPIEQSNGAFSQIVMSKT